MGQYAEPFRSRNAPYASSDFPSTGRHYNTALPYVSRYDPYASVPATQKTPVGAYNFQQNGAYAQTPNYATQVNDSYTPLYLKQKRKSYAFANKDYSAVPKVSGLPPTEKDVDLTGLIRNEMEILAARTQGLKKRVRPIVAAS